MPEGSSETLLEPIAGIAELLELVVSKLVEDDGRIAPSTLRTLLASQPAIRRATLRLATSVLVTSDHPEDLPLYNCHALHTIRIDAACNRLPWQPLTTTEAHPSGAASMSAPFAHLLFLTRFEFGPGCFLQPGELAKLAALPALRHLAFSRCVFRSSDELSHLAALPRMGGGGLVSLDLSHCLGLTPPMLAPVSLLTSLTRLSVSHCPLVTDSALAHLVTLSSLADLDVSHTAVSLTAMDGSAAVSILSRLSRLCVARPAHESIAFGLNASSLESLTALEHLDASCLSLTPAQSVALAALPHLRSLCVTSSLEVGSVELLRSLRPSGTLQALCLDNVRCTAVEPLLSALAALPLLTALRLRLHCPAVVNTEHMCSQLLALRALTHLCLRVLSGAAEDHLSLAAAPALQDLDLWSGAQSVAYLLPRLSELTRLDVSVYDLRVDAADTLARLASLRDLSISAVCVTTSALIERLCSLSQLTNLTLVCQYAVSTAELCLLGTLTSLCSLNLDCLEHVSDGEPGLAAMTGLTRLTRLALLSSSLDSVANLAWLPCFPALQGLAIVGEELSDEGLLHMSRTTSLLELEVYDVCHHVSKHGLRVLSTHPRLQKLQLNGDESKWNDDDVSAVAPPSLVWLNKHAVRPC